MATTEDTIEPATDWQDDSEWETSSEPDEEPVRYNSLRSKRNFPTFANMPYDDEFDARYYRERDGLFLPRRHWCFLGEIIHACFAPRPVLLVRDVQGVKFPLTFQTEERGREIPPATLRVGHTVAVLYAEQGDTTGIRVDEIELFKVIPTSLDKLYQLSDNIRRYSPKVEGKRRCHGCDEEKEVLHKCGVCTQFWYCNKRCQSAGWKSKGHKRECKLLRDRDVRAMFRLDWSRFGSEHLEFPLSNYRRL